MIESRETLAPVDERNSAPVWVYESSFYRPRWHYLVYRDPRLGVQMQIATTWRSGRLGKRHVTTFYLDGGGKTYRSEAKLLRAVAARQKKISRLSGSEGRSPLKRMIFSFSQMMGLW